MAGTKVSQLEVASNVDADDLFYIVNNGAPRKITTASVATIVRSLAALVNKINGKTADGTGAVTLTKSDVGLSDVPNILPVTSINALSGPLDLIPKVGGGLSVTTGTNTIEVSIDSAYSFTWDNLTGDPLANQQLSTVLAGVGVLSNPMRLDAAPYALTIAHTKTMWVDVASPIDVLVDVPILDIAIGSVVELRQAGAGTVGLTYNNQYMTVNVPNGSVIQTSGIGTRIQIVYLGGDAWEYR